jgi:hypothetical protein
MKKRLFSVLLSFALMLSLLPATALATGSAQQEYDLANGSITVSVDADGKQYVTQANGVSGEEQTGETVIKQTGSATATTNNTITITAEAGQIAKVTLSGVNIDVSGERKAALSTSGEGDVAIKLSGSNTLKSGENYAGLEKGNAGTLTISGTNAATDSLTAKGGNWSAGIGGGCDSSVSKITIINSTVTAAGGAGSAGIGGGYNGNGTDIEIKNSAVTATGANGAAGIGGGSGGIGSIITITDSTVTAKGGNCGAGIGGGVASNGSSITISGSSRVRVQGGEGDTDGQDEDLDFFNPNNCLYTIAGSAIGNGSDMNLTRDKSITDSFWVSYEDLDVSKLTIDGWVKCYKTSANMETDDPEDILYAPRITVGDNQSVTQGSQTELTFASDANFNDFQKVILDKESANQTELVNDENCTVKAGEDGSTIVTLKADLTVSLAAGEHTLSIVSKNGTATATFRVVKKSSSNGSSRYAITVNETQNGSVSVSASRAYRGTTVTITTTPDTGYTLETLTVLDKNSEEVALDIVTIGEKYTFKMPSGKVTVTATFMEDNTMLNYFVDVNAQDYFYDAVLWAAENGVTSGTDDSHFSPYDSCTRGQIVTFLWRAAGNPEPKSLISFADVAADSYYAKAVAWAVENGVTNGTGDNTFSPDAVCTKAQAVTLLYRAVGAETEGDNTFPDVADDAYYHDAVTWAEKNEIEVGVCGLFCPDNDCTRAKFVTYLWKAMAE